MNKLGIMLIGLLMAQASAPRVPQIVSENSPSEFGRTVASVFHVRTKGGVTCPAHEQGGGCNDVSHWAIAIRSSEYTLETIGTGLREDAELSLEDEKLASGRRLSKRDLVIHADPTAPYGVVQPVIEAAYAAGFYKVALGLGAPELESIEDVHIALFWDANSRTVVRKIGSRIIKDDADFSAVLVEAREARRRNHMSEPQVLVDAATNVPWAEIVAVVNLCRDVKLTNIQFATNAR